jgi:tetratricopeptide (TPR) repeat protein
LIQFDSQLERNLPAFLENIQPDDLRFLAEVYLASLPDTEILAQFPEVEHSTRVRQLTERLVALPDPRPVILQSALITLSHHEEAAVTIQPMLAELVQLIPLKGLGRMEEYELRQRLQNLLESYVRVCVASDDNQPIMDLLDRADEIDASEGQDNFYHYDDTRSLVSGLLDQEITGCLAKWPHGRIIRILPLLRHLSTPTDKTNDDDVSPAMPFVELNLVAHAMTDNMVEYEAWWQDLSDEQQGVMVNCCANWSVSQAAACLGDRTEENLDLRIRVLKAVFLTAETQGWEEQADLDIEYYEYGMPHVAFGFLYSGEDTTGLLTQRELLEHGPIIAEATPTGGFAWAALAMAQSEQRQLQEALNSWQNAIDCAPKDDSYRQTCWRMEKARLLERLKRNSEALEVLKSLAPDDIDAKFKSEYTTMMEMLSDS